MGIREFFRLPHKHRRVRNQAQGEVNPVGGGENDLAASPHSGPDLSIRSSISSRSALSISQTQGSNGMWTATFRVIHLTVMLRNADDVVSHPTQSAGVRSRQAGNSEPSKRAVKPSAVDQAKSDRRSTTYATTKLAINMVKDASDVFPPLKSIAGGLSAILNHCDV